MGWADDGLLCPAYSHHRSACEVTSAPEMQRRARCWPASCLPGPLGLSFRDQAVEHRRQLRSGGGMVGCEDSARIAVHEPVGRSIFNCGGGPFGEGVPVCEVYPPLLQRRDQPLLHRPHQRDGDLSPRRRPVGMECTVGVPPDDPGSGEGAHRTGRPAELPGVGEPFCGSVVWREAAVRPADWTEAGRRQGWKIRLGPWWLSLCFKFCPDTVDLVDHEIGDLIQESRA